ncbi:MAG: hypothetical protein COB51_12025 [Moraxellaceae bacterium]|nr:MAG: hypothetical protein COB51_12025 [Moraxellaceae bacterium]
MAEEAPTLSHSEHMINSTLQKNCQTSGFLNINPELQSIIPHIIARKDLLIGASNPWELAGALVTAQLQQLSETPEKNGNALRTLIITPSRERASFLRECIKQLVSELNIRYGILVGGSPYPPQIRMLRRAPDILVATPGRMAEHVEADRVNFDALEMLVIDDLDKALDMGCLTEILQIVDSAPKDRQTIITASAFNDLDVHTLASQFQKNDAITIEASNQYDQFNHLNHAVFISDANDKGAALEHLPVNTQFQPTLIVGSQAHKLDLFTALENLGIPYQECAQENPSEDTDRQDTDIQNTDLQNTDFQVIANSSSAAQAENSTDVSAILFYDLHPNPENYFQRLKQFSSASCQEVISLMSPSEKILRNQIQQMAGGWLLEEKFLAQPKSRQNNSVPSANTTPNDDARSRSSGFMRSNTRRSQASQSKTTKQRSGPRQSNHESQAEQTASSNAHQANQDNSLQTHHTPKPNGGRNTKNTQQKKPSANSNQRSGGNQHNQFGQKSSARYNPNSEQKPNNRHQQNRNQQSASGSNSRNNQSSNNQSSNNQSSNNQSSNNQNQGNHGNHQSSGNNYNSGNSYNSGNNYNSGNANSYNSSTYSPSNQGPVKSYNQNDQYNAGNNNGGSHRKSNSYNPNFNQRPNSHRKPKQSQYQPVQYTNSNNAYPEYAVAEKPKATIKTSSRGKYTLKEDELQRLHHQSASGPRIQGRLSIDKPTEENQSPDQEQELQQTEDQQTESHNF